MSKSLLLVHPLYAEFIGTHSDINYYSNYKNNLIKAVKLLENKHEVCLFSFNEALSIYSKIINEPYRVFLTVPGSGWLIDKSSIDYFIGKSVLIAGCYAELCVTDVIIQLVDAGVRDLSLLIDCLMVSQRAPQGVLHSNNELLKLGVTNGSIGYYRRNFKPYVFTLPYRQIKIIIIHCNPCWQSY